MSNAFIKNLPWIAPTVAILAVGSGFLDRINISLDGGNDAVAEAPVEPVADPAAAAVAAVEPVAPVDEPVAPPEDVADQLAALLDDTSAASDIEVTRSQGFSIDTLEQARDVALGVEPATPQAQTGSVDATFFAAAQANLARDRQCIDELRVLATQARVYFPSGGLTADQNGIEQARLLGVLAQQCPGVTIQVEGHSDPSGDPVINQRLSRERAEAVVGRVVASGLDRSLFTAVGRGDTVPSLVEGPQPAAYYDRRVEFVVVENATNASLTTPTFGAGASNFQTTACVQQLQSAVTNASIEYAPRGLTVGDADLALATQLARIATNCPEARLRLIGHHSGDAFAGEDSSTGRLRAVVLMTRLVNAGFPSEQLILAAPSDPRPVAGVSDSRVDFDVILEEL